MGESLEVLGKPVGVVGGPVGDELGEDLPLPSAGGRQQGGALVRDGQLGAPGIAGRGRPGHVAALDGPADEPAGAGAIDADLVGDVADGDRTAPGCRVDGLEDQHVHVAVVDVGADPPPGPEADEAEQGRPGIVNIACDTHIL